MLKLLAVPAQAFSETRALNLPALTVTPREIANAVGRLVPKASTLIEWGEDPMLQKVVDSWPAHFSSKQALELGLEPDHTIDAIIDRSEEHTSELQSLMRISYAVFCLKKKNNLQ